MSLKRNFGLIHNYGSRFAFCLCFVFLTISTNGQEEIVCIEAKLSCVISVSVLTGGGRLNLDVLHCNVALNHNHKKSMLLAFLSLMHATICMHITDTEMHMAERFLNS